MIITIDGPAGTGKTTVARLVADKLGFLYFDTGAMYRAVTLLLLKEGIDWSDETRVQSLLTTFRFAVEGGRYFANDLDVTEEIRSEDVTKNVSAVSALQSVRESLVAIQRRFGEAKNCVFEGRDMGSVVFPQADLKVFLTARPAVRAERRYLELKYSAGKSTEDVMKELERRDLLDSTREHSPLKQPEGAHLIDTSDLSMEQVVGNVLSLIPSGKKYFNGSR